jgi:hypothetical protein
MDDWRVGQIWMVDEWGRYGWKEGGADTDVCRVRQIWMVRGWGIQIRMVGAWGRCGWLRVVGMILQY